MRFAVVLAALALTAACAAAPEHSVPPAAAKDALVRQGYRPVTLHGQLLYCRSQPVTGTQFADSVCLSEAQIGEQQRQVRETTQSRAMHPNLQCNPRDCP